ncbi:MAG: hypothetical protein HPY55_15735 [Firmicutes bacterium]|nr:hypothetical protein [Bacillota bacterium]
MKKVSTFGWQCIKLTQAFRGHHDVAVLVCGDNDFVAVVEAVNLAIVGGTG